MSPALLARRAFAPVLAMLLVAPPALRAQGAAGDTVRYTVGVDPAAKLFRVAVELPAGGSELAVSLPAWSPGSYTIENYARSVRNFTAADDAGRALMWEKRDPDTWRVQSGGAKAVRLTFEVYADSLDLDKSKVFSDFAFFNGTNLFPFEGEHLGRPAVLTVELPSGWKVATGLPSAGAPNRFWAKDYDQLVDAPTFIGNFQLDAFTAAGKPAQLAVYPADAFNAEQRGQIRSAIDRILTTQGEIVGSIPFDSYTVLLYVGSWETGFAGGLEHANSHFDILDPAFAEVFDQAFPILQSLLAHETFHLWNVKRIRPAAMWPYDYEEWQPTELLWFSEGVTDYYADLTLVRSGLYDQDLFLGQIENNLARLEAEPAPIAVEDASLSTWLGPNPNFGDPYIYYPKGSLLGLILDVRIRSGSGNQRSLDTVVRELYSDFYSAGRGFTTPDLLRLIEEAGFESDAFYASYITGREPLPLEEVLALGGIALRRQEVEEPFLGVSAGPTATGDVVVGAVAPGSPADAAGVQAGDVLVAVGTVEVGGDPTYGERYRQAYARQGGASLPIKVRRGNEELVLQGKVRLQKRVTYEVEADPAAGDQERRIFADLTGAASR